jgi:Trk K+ transport system NAD-binding subunit
VIRGNDFVVPRGDTAIEVDDRVIFIGPSPAVQEARDVVLLKR